MEIFTRMTLPVAPFTQSSPQAEQGVILLGPTLQMELCSSPALTRRNVLGLQGDVLVLRAPPRSLNLHHLPFLLVALLASPH